MTKPYMKIAIASALKDLVRKKSFQKITINDIITVCEISKQTFYNYFKDKTDLIIFTCTLEAKKILKEAMLSADDYKTAIMQYYEDALRQKYFYRAFIKEDYLRNILFNAVADCSSKHVTSQIEHYCGSMPISQELTLVIHFNAAGNAHLFVEWICGGMTTPPDIMAAANYTCIPEPLKQYFNCDKISALY